jgi:hypothetical protein
VGIFSWALGKLAFFSVPAPSLHTKNAAHESKEF